MLERVSIVTGGFPCQDVSHAGTGAGLAGERSGLWRAMADTVRMVRPDYAVVENVAALLERGMGEVCGDLADIGYNSEWDCISAAELGAPHHRDRVFIVADAASNRLERNVCETAPQAIFDRPPKTLATWDAPSSPFRDWRKLLAETRPCRMAYGLPGRLDKKLLHALGNAVVPQIAEWIGRRIIEANAQALSAEKKFSLGSLARNRFYGDCPEN
jgi:DNA (cytosine-5)-methyltransferase 1